MQYKFDTTSIKHADAARLLYAIYRSRGKDSPLNGLETWERFEEFARGACLKSNTTAEFVQEFCKKAKVSSIKPKYLDTGEAVPLSGGALVVSEGIKNYNLSIIEDNDILKIINSESIYIILLVRERIQREKYDYVEEDDEEI
jgi:hypothetical protein